ncbi:MAG: putative drug exporter of the superfamily [Solirubrobacterales bacterium]|nr:putative drug exporter of the superfamily [Solirubrobacterales bacterium]
MSSLTRWVLAHKRTVVISWILLTIAGIMAAGPASRALNQKFSVPNKEGWETNQAIAAKYNGTGGDTNPLLPVVTLPDGESIDSPQVKSDLAKLDAELAHALPGARVASYASTGDPAFVSADGHTTFAIVYPRPDPNSSFGDNPQAAKDAKAAVAGTTVGGAPVHVTGFDALQQSTGGGNGPGVLLEALLGGLGALIVLGFVFASFLAVVPIMMAISSILTTFLLLLGLTTFTDVSPIVQFLVALVGLGVAIDYSLLVVSRWREERAHGASSDEAVQRAMETAGRAVVFSGITVAIGLLALIALPLPFLRSMGYGGMLIPLVSTLVAITLLPVILAKAGPRLDWPHRRTDDKASRAWTRWAQAVSKRRWLAAGAGMAVILALALAATNLQLGASDANTIAKQGDAEQGLKALENAGIGEGSLLPHEILASGSTAQAHKVAQDLNGVTGIHGAVAPSGPEWNRDGTHIVEAIPIPDSGTSAGHDTLTAVRDTAHAAGPDVRVGGGPAANQDFIDAVYGSFPLMIALIAITTFILLARAFRSLLLPLKAIILNVLSVAAAWGVLVLVWQDGYGSDAIWGIQATGSIQSWMPLIIFAFLFGLSMDYEVFILSRMREEYDRTGSTETAVVQGIGRTGRLVTSAALILFLAFTSMASGPDTSVKMLATGLAAGILLDATIIRALIVPAVISLMGRWNWWLPSWPARLLRVEPSLARSVAAGEAEG